MGVRDLFLGEEEVEEEEEETEEIEEEEEEREDLLGFLVVRVWAGVGVMVTISPMGI